MNKIANLNFTQVNVDKSTTFEKAGKNLASYLKEVKENIIKLFIACGADPMYVEQGHLPISYFLNPQAGYVFGVELGGNKYVTKLPLMWDKQSDVIKPVPNLILDKVRVPGHEIKPISLKKLRKVLPAEALGRNIGQPLEELSDEDAWQAAHTMGASTSDDALQHTVPGDLRDLEGRGNKKHTWKEMVLRNSVLGEKPRAPKFASEELIKLAYENPELRSELLPIIMGKKAAVEPLAQRLKALLLTIKAKPAKVTFQTKPPAPGPLDQQLDKAAPNTGAYVRGALKRILPKHISKIREEFTTNGGLAGAIIAVIELPEMENLVTKMLENGGRPVAKEFLDTVMEMLGVDLDANAKASAVDTVLTKMVTLFRNDAAQKAAPAEAAKKGAPAVEEITFR